jgi:phage shock protein E
MRIPKTKKAPVFALALVLLFAFAAYGWEAPLITRDDLKATLGKPNLIVLDVRTDGDWAASQWKILGAVREEPDRVQSWMNKYPKDKTLVLYCA